MLDEQIELPEKVIDYRVVWLIECRTEEDTPWVECTANKADPADVVRTLEYREKHYPDDQHRLVRSTVLVSVDDVEAVRALIPEKPAPGDAPVLQSS